MLKLLTILATSGLFVATAAAQEASQPGEDAGQPLLQLDANAHTATVTALAFTPDSRRLCSAGLDKVVQVWNLAMVRGIKLASLQRGHLLRERTIRWQIGRGPLGSLYALAMAPQGRTMAMGGYGVMGDLGEILLVDPVTGNLQHVLREHHATITSLAFSQDARGLASASTDGRLLLWTQVQDRWQLRQLYKPDSEELAAHVAAAETALARGSSRPVVMLGSTHLVWPVLPRDQKPRRPEDLVWRLQRVRLENQRDYSTLAESHQGLVTALAATPDGRWLASADARGNTYVWDLERDAPPRRLPVELPVASLAFRPDGKVLVGGTVSSGDRPSQLLHWDVATGRLVSRQTVGRDHVTACAFSPDGLRLAYTGELGNAIFLTSHANPQGPETLQLSSQQVWKVAFARQGYRFALGTKPRPPEQAQVNELGVLDLAFDPEKLQLAALPADAAETFRTAEADGGPWSVGWQQIPESNTWQMTLMRGGVSRGYVQLDARFDGRPRSYCFVPGEGGPAGLAVGTDKLNHVYVFGLAEQGPCPLLRAFRGHEDRVVSLSASADGKYLLSGSGDGTARLWSLHDLPHDINKAEAHIATRWGASFGQRDGRLLVTAIDKAGPLFRRGVRVGDVISEIRWSDSQRSHPGDLQRHSALAVNEIYARLHSLPWITQVEFFVTRPGAVGKEFPSFQSFPAWHALAALYIDTDREWAYWTPEGYYGASANGHTLFGWQVRRGVQQLPDFFGADQFRRTLERPAVLEQLLRHGNLDDALASQPDKVAAAEDPEAELARQVRNTPRVRIVSPEPGATADGESLTIAAVIEVPPGVELRRPRAMANGVTAVQQNQAIEHEGPAGCTVRFQWQAALPADRLQRIQVVVDTDKQTLAADHVKIERLAVPESPRRRLFLMAVGVDEFEDARIPDLNCCVHDAQTLARLFEVREQPPFAATHVQLLKNREVTRLSWKDRWTGFVNQLVAAKPSPDDLVVLFLAGHGHTGQRGTAQQDGYFYTPYDAQVDHLADGSFQSFIRFGGFEGLAELPCRKLVVLDTCYSGSIRPALRDLQDESIFTLTATGRHEQAQEQGPGDDWQGHGAFTYCLLAALKGQADKSGDGLVTLDELIRHVELAVPALTAEGQHPEAAPSRMMPYVTIPLTQAPIKQD